MSSGALLLPSVNRSLPRIVTRSSCGIVAYACRYSIYFLDTRCCPPLLLDSKFLFKAHLGKIIALSFRKHEGTELLTSISESRELKVWDMETKTCVIKIDVGNCTRVAEWLHGSSNILIYPSDFRTIVKWDFDKGLHGISKVRIGSDVAVTQIVSNEKSPHLLAIGYMNGLINVMDIVKETVLEKFKVHSMEITSLSWSPIVPDNLLSMSLDLSLRMWKVGERQPLWSYYMQVARHKYDDKKKLRIVGICHPRDPNVAICSNLRGDVGEVVYSETEKPKFSFYYQGNCDLNCKSSFAFFISTIEEGKTDILYCFDPFKVTLWNVTEKRLSSQIPFMSQFVYDLTVSSANPNLLAISNGEGLLKVVNSVSEATKMDVISVYVHIKTRIMTAAWHPISENIIAYATDEGRVGVIDISKRKAIYTFETHHTGAIYSLSWAPCEKILKTDPEIGKTVYFVYSCGGGIIYINQENNAKGNAKNFDDLVERPPDIDTTEKTHSELCWKSDFSCLCLGSFKGYIDVYTNTFLFLMRFNVQMKSVECLRWHPENTYMSPDGSSLKCWLACSGNDEQIHIIDTSSHQEQDNVSQGAIKKLIGHHKRIVSLCWSQHKDGFLVSASKDGSALVWDVLAGTIIATYLSHQDVVFSVQWSVFDQDIIYSGGQDGSVRIWKISEQTAFTPPSNAPRRKRMRKPTSTKATDENNSEDGNYDDENNAEINKKAVKTVSSESSVAETIHSRKIILFPYHASAKNADLEDCIKLTDILSGNSSAQMSRTLDFASLKSSTTLNSEEVIKFGLFSDQLTAMRMIETQGDLHKSAGDLYYAQCLQLMAGNIQPQLEEAAKTKSLNTFLVAMAPSVSHSFWLKMCEKFAEQLLEQHRYMEASFQYLACGKLYDAINVLAEKGNVIDALALAKSRLPESDPLIPNLLLLARKKFVELHNSLGEAECYLSLNQPLAAAKTIASSNDPNYIRIAAYICKKFKLDREAEDYRFLCMEKCLAKFNYAAFTLLVKQEPCMQVYSALMSVHFALHHHIKLLKKSDGIAIKELFSNHEAGSEIQFWKGSICIDDSKQSFIAYVHQHLLSQELLSTDKSILINLLDALEILFSKKSIFGTVEAHVTIAIYITKLIILSLLQDVDAATNAFLKIFEASYNVVFLPKIMYSLFFPMCISWDKDTNNMICTSVVLEESLNGNVILEAIYNNFCERITSYMKQPIEIFITSSDLQNNLQFITDRIAVILDTKKVEEYLLAYFVSCVINDITLLMEKKNLKLKCYKTAISEKSPARTDMLIKLSQNLETKVDVNETDNNVSKYKEEVEAVNELINLAIHEAEEKAKSFTEPETSPVLEAPSSHINDDINCEKSQVENTSDAVATNIYSVEVAQCCSQIDKSLNSARIVNFSNGGEEESEIDRNISKEGKIEDSFVISNGNISHEKIIPSTDEYKISDNDVIPIEPTNKHAVYEGVVTHEMNALDNEAVTSENGFVPDILSNNESAVSNDVIIFEKEALVEPNSSNALFPDVDLSNSELLNIIIKENALNDNGLSCHNDIPEAVDKPKNEVPEENLLKNELIVSNKDFTLEESEEPNPELDLPKSGLILEVIDQLNNEAKVSVSILHEEILSNNEQGISNNGKVFTPEELEVPNTKLDLPNNGLKVNQFNNEDVVFGSNILHEHNLIRRVSEDTLVIPNNDIECTKSILSVNEEAILNSIIASEAVIQPNIKDNEDLSIHTHEKCLENIDMFYNVISLITQNICKDEFALLFYLKERVKFLYQARAAEALNKFSKEKANSKVDVRTKKKKAATNSLKNKTLVEKEVSSVSENSNLNLKLDKSVDSSSEICTNSVEIVDKIISLGTQSLEEKAGENIDDSENNEYVDSNSEVCTNDVDEIVDKTSTLGIQSLEEIAMENIDGPDNNKSVDSNSEVCTNVDEIVDKTSTLGIQSFIEKAVENIDGSDKNESIDSNSEVCTNDVDEIVYKTSTPGIQRLDENIDGSDNNSCTTVNTNEMLKKVEDICEEHNYCSPKECDENALISQGSSSGISKDVDISFVGSCTGNFQNELEEILELVRILEKKSEKFSYPNPFDVIPKILRALYDVAQKSPCECVQEKLHSFIHDIVCWAERYAVGDINFVCQICKKKSVV